MSQIEKFSKNELLNTLTSSTLQKRKEGIQEMKRRGIFELKSLNFKTVKTLKKDKNRIFKLVQPKKKEEQHIVLLEEDQIIFSYPEIGIDEFEFKFELFHSFEGKTQYCFTGKCKEVNKKGKMRRTNWLYFFDSTTFELKKVKFKIDEDTFYSFDIDASKQYILIGSQFDDFPGIQVFDLEKTKLIHFNCNDLDDLGYMDCAYWGKTLENIVIEGFKVVPYCEAILDWKSKTVRFNLDSNSD